MKKNRSALPLFFFFIFPIIILSSCTKINQATELGKELIPAADNITTFDTTLYPLTYNGLFSDIEDSSKSSRNSLQYTGAINNDPLFGSTTATAFFQLKPGYIKSPFPFSKDSLVGLDSVVLVLGYRETYGDTTSPLPLTVFEVAATNSFRADTSYLIRQNNFVLGPSLGPAKTFIPAILNDSVFPYNEKAANQLRIPLDKSFGQRLINYDTSNAYASDSAFKTYFNGFAVAPQNNKSGNALIGFNLSDTNTKLSFYVRYQSGGKIETAVINFRFNNTTAAANYIKRDYAGSQFAAHQNSSAPDNLLFIQSTPGSYATIKIPGLSSLSNRVIHRAELVVQQIPDPSDLIFPPPQYLFLDAYDSAKSRYRTIPFDFTYSPSTFEFDAASFGMIGKKSMDPSGNAIQTWSFNVSRYVQHVVNGTQPAYTFRLSAPYILKELYSNGATDVDESIGLLPRYAVGRVRMGGGNHATQRMKLHIVYSKL